MRVISLLPLYKHLVSDLGTLNVATVSPDKVIVTSYKALLEGELPKASDLVPFNARSSSEYDTDLSIVDACLVRTMSYLEERRCVPPAGWAIRRVQCRTGRLILDIIDC